MARRRGDAVKGERLRNLELLRIFHQSFRPQLQGDLRKGAVAGVHQGLAYGDLSVGAFAHHLVASNPVGSLTEEGLGLNVINF